MKKRYFNILIALILITLASLLMLVGCSNIEFNYKDADPVEYGNGIDDDDDNAEDDTDQSETDDILEVDISLFADGETEFDIVISDLASEVISASANDIKTAFANKLGVPIKIRNETHFKMFNAGSMQGSKIVVGTLSEDPLSVKLERPLRDGEYLLKVTDGSLYILGGNEESTVQAVNYFINKYIKNAQTPLDFEPGILYKKNTSAAVINMTVSGNDIWKYKIIYDDTVFGKACAQRVRDAIAAASNYTLTMSADSEAETDYEILVGKTNRAASDTVRSKYNRPNVYYNIETVDKKLVIMGEGYTTLNAVAEWLEGYVTAISGEGQNFYGNVKEGNVIALIDAGAGESMFTRASDTDLRVMHWNMAAPYLNDELKVYTDNKTRGEIMADAILQLYPDILTTNEFYKSHNGDSTLYDAVMGELSEYYNILESEYEVGKPAEDADAIEGKTINSNIIYKKSAGMTVISSGWRYSSEKTDATEDNPDGWVYYHGYHTALFKTYYGDRFILSVAHNADSRTDSTWAEEHLEAVEDMKAASESADGIPMILTGDMYTFINHDAQTSGAGYYYLQGQGYSDAQVSALVNANAADGCIDSDNKKHGTFHAIGVREIQRASEDLIWTKNGFEALKFKVLTTKEAQDTSDHYPVVADLKLN